MIYIKSIYENVISAYDRFIAFAARQGAWPRGTGEREPRLCIDIGIAARAWAVAGTPRCTLPA